MTISTERAACAGPTSATHFAHAATAAVGRRALRLVAMAACCIGLSATPSVAAELVYFLPTSVPAEQTERPAPTRLAARTMSAPATPIADMDSSEGCVLVNGVRMQDEIVLVNARPLGCSTDPARMATGLRLQAYEMVDESGCRHWQPYDLDSFLSSDPQVTTIIFVHGNQISPGQDKQVGLRLYRRLVRCQCDGAPIRFVIFSWPASKTRGPLRDYRIKAARTRPVGWELAWLLDQMPAETPVGLIGYSYGARIITGGLHIVGGGSLGGLALDAPVHPDRSPVRVVLVAAALNSNWLGPNQYHGMAMSQVDQMLLLNNREDIAMRFYYLSATCGRPQALGLCGPTYIAPEDAWKIRNRDMSRYDGPRHDLFRYLAGPGAASQAWDYLTFEEVGSPAPN